MKLLIVVAALLLAGCATKSDYEIRLFLDRETLEVNGYIRINGDKHSVRVTYDEKQ